MLYNNVSIEKVFNTLRESFNITTHSLESTLIELTEYAMSRMNGYWGIESVVEVDVVDGRITLDKYHRQIKGLYTINDTLLLEDRSGNSGYCNDQYGIKINEVTNKIKVECTIIPTINGSPAIPDCPEVIDALTWYYMWRLSILGTTVPGYTTIDLMRMWESKRAEAKEALASPTRSDTVRVTTKIQGRV